MDGDFRDMRALTIIRAPNTLDSVPMMFVTEMRHAISTTRPRSSSTERLASGKAAETGNHWDDQDDQDDDQDDHEGHQDGARKVFCKDAAAPSTFFLAFLDHSTAVVARRAAPMPSRMGTSSTERLTATAAAAEDDSMAAESGTGASAESSRASSESSSAAAPGPCSGCIG